MRASYQAAINWIADNDDTVWVITGEDMQSVTAAMVCDLFGKDEKIVRKHIARALKERGHTKEPT